jgi:3'-phosphoadenosine 5'-phosphosulfate sulfotransferase (PAPS reductase)/FAD synthetase
MEFAMKIFKHYNTVLPCFGPTMGYRSIGCAPCIRAVRAGEDARAGRWWWEN